MAGATEFLVRFFEECKLVEDADLLLAHWMSNPELCMRLIDTLIRPSSPLQLECCIDILHVLMNKG